MFQVELEKLNKASEEINRLELELDVSFCCCSVPQLNTLKVTRYVHPHLYVYTLYKCRYTA